MILNTNIGFLWIVGYFGLQDTFKERIAPKPTEIDTIFYVQGNLRTRALKNGTPVKVVILPLLASLMSKRLQISLGMLPITISTSDELFSSINIDDFERPRTSKIGVFSLIFAIFGCSAHPRINCDEMAGDRLTVCKQELL